MKLGGEQYWSDEANHCDIPGCLSALVRVGEESLLTATATPTATEAPTLTDTPEATATDTPEPTQADTPTPMAAEVSMLGGHSLLAGLVFIRGYGMILRNG